MAALYEPKTNAMKKFIVERKLPGAGNMTPEELKAVAKASNEVIVGMGKPYSWVQSFVTEDKIYCIHIAESEADVREHARCGGFPINTIEEVKESIDPSSAG
jgi:uncharacterized protein DUF4242